MQLKLFNGSQTELKRSCDKRFGLRFETISRVSVKTEDDKKGQRSSREAFTPSKSYIKNYFVYCFQLEFGKKP